MGEISGHSGIAVRFQPAGTDELEAGERLFLGALRHWLLGLGGNSGGSPARAWNELARELGPARGRSAMSGLIGLVREMGHLRRPLRCHMPCCRFVSPDERALLGFIGSCQKRDWNLARARAEWLTGPEGIGGMLEAGARLGAALAEAGLEFPPRAGVRARQHALDGAPGIDPGIEPRLAPSRRPPADSAAAAWK